MRAVCLLVFLVCHAPLLRGENWPQWRGPRLDGTSRDKGVPTEVSEKNLLWKTELPGEGHASPIVWEDRIFLIACIEEDEDRVLLCLDRKDGKLLWKTPVLHAPLEGKHKLNSRASSTPATDGEKVFTSFLNFDRVLISAHDFSGKQVWQKDVGEFHSKHGFSSSPILFEDLVIVNCDHDGNGYLVALARQDGTERWRIDRPNHTRSYCVPLIRELAGKTQMVLSGTKCVASYDPRSGKPIWMIDGPTEQFVASLVYNDQTGLLYMSGGYPEHHILAIRPDGAGNVTDTHVQWRTNKGVAYVPSPICEGTYFLIVSDSGIAHCFDAATGEICWEERMREHHASLVSAQGQVYFINDFGTLRVVKPGQSYQLVAESELGERVFASPALSEGQILVRGSKSLFCLGQRQAPPTAP